MVVDKATQQILQGVTVEEGTNKTISKASTINISNLTAGKHVFVFSFVGYQSTTLEVTLPDTTTHEVLISVAEKVLEEVNFRYYQAIRM